MIHVDCAFPGCNILVPYSIACGTAVTPDHARGFGRGLAQARAAYMQD
jgi:hypothetical protein